MTRARARNIENEVTSFLSEFHSVSLENGILPQRDTLCVLRYKEDDREEEKTEIQAYTEEKSEEGSKEEKPPGHIGCPASPTPGARPHHLGATPAYSGCPDPWLLGALALLSQPLAAPSTARAWDPWVLGPSQPPAWLHPGCPGLGTLGARSSSSRPPIQAGCPAPFAPGARPPLGARLCSVRVPGLHRKCMRASWAK